MSTQQQQPIMARVVKQAKEQPRTRTRQDEPQEVVVVNRPFWLVRYWRIVIWCVFLVYLLGCWVIQQGTLSNRDEVSGLAFMAASSVTTYRVVIGFAVAWTLDKLTRD